MSYYGFVVTDSGRELIAKLVAGQQLPISKIMVGSGTIPDDVKPAAMTALVEPVAAGTSTAPVDDCRVSASPRPRDVEKARMPSSA